MGIFGLVWDSVSGMVARTAPAATAEPWWFVKIASIIGGIAGGWMTQQIIGHQDASGLVVLTTMVGAFVTGGFLGGVVGLAAGGRGNVAAGG